MVEGNGPPTFDDLAPLVVSNGKEVIGLPVTVTVQDRRTEEPVVSFTRNSNGDNPCSVVYDFSEGWNFYGESERGWEACPFRLFHVPEGHILDIQASFAGNSQYAASSSEYELFL